MRHAVLIVLLLSVAFAQEVQLKKVYDFSGGLANSIDPALMNENQAQVLLNYDIDRYGNLRRRHALRAYAWNGSIYYVSAILPFKTQSDMDLMILARLVGAGGGGPHYWTSIFGCNLADSSCDQIVRSYLYYPWADWTVPYNFSLFSFRDTLYFASAHGEFVYWDGDSLWLVRDTSPTQPFIFPINDDDSITGIYTYGQMVVMNDTTVNNNDDTILGAESWAESVHYGRMYVSNFLDSLTHDTVTNLQFADTVYVYRKAWPDTTYIKVAAFSLYSPDDTPKRQHPPAYWYDIDTSTYTDTLTVDLAESVVDSTCADSIIPFRPMCAVRHQARAYAIGDPQYPNRLYYSASGEMTRWPCDHFIDLPSTQGDWLTALYSTGTVLFMFRQNSIDILRGHNFYQFSVTNYSSDIGASSPRSVASVAGLLFVFHTTGVYVLDPSGETAPKLISQPISQSIDSFKVSQGRAVGASINNEYWLSLDFGSSNQQTYAFSFNPIPHWKSYDFGFSAVVQFDIDTMLGTWGPNSWLVETVTPVGSPDGNALFYQFETDNLDASFDRTDTIDIGLQDTLIYSAIVCQYRSKDFFAGEEREKIYWLDIVGSGTADTITFIFRDGDSVFDSTAILPDFTDDQRDRVIIDHEVTSFSVEWRDNGHGQYIIEGYEIGWKPKSGGRPTP